MARTENRMHLTHARVRDLPHEEDRRSIKWDDVVRGLAVEVQPKPSTRKAWKFCYSIQGRSRWVTIGDALAMTPEEARRRANVLRVKVDDGLDPAADNKKKRNDGYTFASLYQRFLDEKPRNKSWKQTDHLIRKNVLPLWQEARADAIDARQVRELLVTLAKKPSLRNQVQAAVSSVFQFAVDQYVIKANPARGIAKLKTPSRSRILYDDEISPFWEATEAIDPVRRAALRVILLTGQRPGEVCHMRREHFTARCGSCRAKSNPMVGPV
jgi:integrase